MKMNKYVFTLFLMFLSFVFPPGCSKHEPGEAGVFPTTIYEQEFFLDDIASELTVTVLDYDSVLVARIMDIQYHHPYLYVRSAALEGVGRLSLFSLDGKLIRSMDNTGRGPGEYLIIQQFGIDDNGTIYINTRHKIVVYDSNLNYMRDIKWPLDLNRAAMHVHNNHIYLFPEYFDELPEYDWIVLDTLGKIVSTKPFNYYHKIGYPPPFELIVFQNDNKLYRYRSISDTIFEVYIDGYNTAYTIDRNYSDGYRMYSQEEISTCRRFDILMKSLYNVKLRYPESISGIGEKWIVEFRTHLRRNVHYETAMIDLQKNKLTLVNRFESVRGDPVYWGIPNDWIGFGPMKPMDVIVIDSEYYILSVMDVFKLKGLVKTETFINGVPKRPALKLKLQTLVDSLDLESDPVLFMLKVK